MKLRKPIIGFKFITNEMKSSNGNLEWNIGKWVKHRGKIEFCKSGIHACRTPLQSLNYIYGDKWFIVEAKGMLKEEGNKFVCSEMRLVRELPIDKIVKRFAIWCAKQCLKNYEKEYPNDKRVYEAIERAELYLDKRIGVVELIIRINAARSAAWSAKSAAESAKSAAWSAAWSAKSAAWSAAWSAKSAAWSAAESAAESAESAARSAKSAAESAQNSYLSLLIKEELTTEEDIVKLKKDEIFVFGSNLAGRHEAGAAKLAKDKFGAEVGIGEGITGQCYAFPTLDKGLNKRKIKDLTKSIERFKETAEQNPDKIFLLTKVGCGIAGYKEKVIKNLFKDIPLNITLPKGWGKERFGI